MQRVDSLILTELIGLLTAFTPLQAIDRMFSSNKSFLLIELIGAK